MRAEVVERRQAVVSRLVALRADGRLQSQVVRAAAESLGVAERTVWRWLVAGSCRDLSRPVRSRFEALEADGILDRRYRVYRASHIALYSTFRVTGRADQGTDKRLGRSTDKTRESG